MTGNQIFLKNVKGLLEERGENFVELSKHIGVSASAISQWYSGLTFPRRKTQEKIAEYLNTTVSLLFDTTRASCTTVSPAEYVNVLSGNTFYINVYDDSMSPLFSNGDIITVKRQSEVQDGDFAVVRINDTYLIREIQRSTKGIMFLPQNNNYPTEWVSFNDERLTAEKIVIVGKVTELFKKFN